MGRSTIIANGALLETARHLFLTESFAVSTSRIANKASVSDESLFKRFGTKENLFRCAIGLPSELKITAKIDALQGKGLPHEDLELVARELLDFFRICMPRIMTLRASHNMHPGQVFENDAEKSPLKRLLDRVHHYLKIEGQEGRLSVDDPEVAARTLLSTMHNIAFFEALGLEVFSENSEDEYIVRVLRVIGLGEQGETHS